MNEKDKYNFNPEVLPPNESESEEGSLEVIGHEDPFDDVPIEEEVVIPELTVLKTPNEQVLEKVMPNSMGGFVDKMAELIKKVRKTDRKFDANLADEMSKNIQVLKGEQNRK